MSKSNKSPASLKPYKEFPLTPHRGAQQWCKKHRGHTYYFGPLSDWQTAKKKFEHDWPYIIQGLTPPAFSEDGDACALRTLTNFFLEPKRNKIAAGELTELSYRDYFRSCKRLIDYFGANRRVDDLRANDFEKFRDKLVVGDKGKRRGVTTMLNEVNRIRVILKYAPDQRLIPQPVHFGQSFDRPSNKARRKARNEAGPRMFTQAELRTVLDALDGKPVKVDGEDVTLAADPQLKAMTLLGLNVGLGVTDCANLSESHVDLETGWLDYPRVKTETPRRAPLWPETDEAIKTVLASRKPPRETADAGIVFLTRTWLRWVRTKQEVLIASEIAYKEEHYERDEHLEMQPVVRMTDGELPQAVDDSPALSDSSKQILLYLSEKAPVLQSVLNIAEDTKLCRDRVSRWLNKLIESRLAHRPEGNLNGATVTPKGQEIALQLIQKRLLLYASLPLL